MPVCQFFFRGKCSNDNCPYLSTLTRRRTCARIFSKDSVHEDNRYVYSHFLIILLYAALICIVMQCHFSHGERYCVRTSLHASKKVTEAGCLVDSQVLEMHICVYMLS